MEDKKDLKPFNSIIQVCPVCGKVDAYQDDGHSCEEEIIKQEGEDYCF